MPKLLIIGYIWPEPTSSAAGSRMMQLIHFFLKEDYSICFATTAVETPFMEDLQELGVKTRKIELNSESFNVFLAEHQPELILFDRFMMEEQFGWRVSEVCPDAIKVLDTEDLHFLRKARQEAVKKDLPLNTSMLQSDTAKREIASIYRCDLSLIISEAEMELLKGDFKVPESLLFYFPLIQKISPATGRAKVPGFKEREHFLSIGNFRHEPNWDAVLQLKETIWPMIRESLPKAELHIYGAYPTQKVFQLDQPRTGFFIKGRAASVEEVMSEAKVLLAPLRFGAGIKGKFLDAMQEGLPSVTTNLGAEGMAGKLAWGGYIENDTEKFAQAAITLHEDEEKWKKAQQNGFDLLEKRFTGDSFENEFREKIKTFKEGLKTHRQQNFTGRMLLHHQLNSTRYLSKYIELKNK